MGSPRFWFLAAALGAVAVGDVAFAQQPTTYPAPLLKAVFPPGARAGTTVEVTADGADLDGATDLYFSAPGLKAERVPDPPADPKKKAPAPRAKFKVTVAADAPVGVHDLRVVGKWGISNPRAFAVGELPEVAEKEPNSDVPQAQRVELGTVADGVIADRTDVDYFAFAGKKGQRVVAHCAASSVDSRLTAHLQLFTADGRELAGNHFYRDRDALVSAELPADGDYHVRVCDFAYQGGGAEYPYRLTLSAGPWVDAAFPPAVPAGRATPVTLYGRNLPGGAPDPACPGRQKLTVTVSAPAATAPFPDLLLPRAGTADGFAYRLAGSNPVFLALSDGPAVLDNGNNDGPETAQPVAVPCDVCGRFEKRDDRDYYSFGAKKGETVVVEGFADRLRAPIDLYFVILRAKDGQPVGEFDAHPDVPETADRFFTHTDDPLARFTAPEDGTYLLAVRSRGAVTGTEPRDVYRVSIRRERPDFRLVLVGNHDNGAGFTLHRGGSQAIQVVCLRQDGFDGEVTLAAEGLPPGVSCEPQVIGPKVRQAALVLTAATDARDRAGAFRVTGAATVGGKKATREARSGCLVFPTGNNNVPAVSRLARSLCLAVRDPGPFALSPAQKELAAPVGGAATVKVKVDARRADMKDAVSVTLLAGPVQSNGRPLSAGTVNVAPNKDGAVRLAIPSNTPPGRYALVFRGSGKYALDDPEKKKRSTQYAAASAPVVLTVFNSACELALAPDPVSVRPGGEAAVAVAVK
ncbi:MAG: pre-peptidase C-terminal domain-containing protein, partial [Planctomycetes bacterium]|nr:pre-peptidase C-terminal domain-containing protein [Planctomycetota bacterium]